MKIKTYKCNSFNVHTIKTDKFKTTHMEIMFRCPVVKEDLAKQTFLIDMLSETSKKYPKRKDLIIKFEELYKTSLYGSNIKTGQMLIMNFITDFINPNFITDKNYLEEVIKLPFELIERPNVVNEEFDLKQFNIIKERLIKEINSISDNPFKLCMKKAFEAMDKDSPSSYSLYGTVDELKSITPASLYKMYKQMLKNSVCDIFIIGNLDMDEAVSLIKKHFKYRYINNNQIPLYVNNKIKKKELIINEKSDNIQANMTVIYNINNLTDNEKHIVFQVFNYIFGNGGLTSKLYQKIREENSLCYSISSMYMKYDNLLAIHVSLDNNNTKKALTLIKKCLKEMNEGKFSEEELNDAKMNICMSLDFACDNNVSLLNNYVFNYFDNFPMIDERKEMYKKVTREDVINVSKKLKLNTVFILEGKGE